MFAFVKLNAMSLTQHGPASANPAHAPPNPAVVWRFTYVTLLVSDAATAMVPFAKRVAAMYAMLLPPPTRRPQAEGPVGHTPPERWMS